MMTLSLNGLMNSIRVISSAQFDCLSRKKPLFHFRHLIVKSDMHKNDAYDDALGGVCVSGGGGGVPLEPRMIKENVKTANDQTVK